MKEEPTYFCSKWLKVIIMKDCKECFRQGKSGYNSYSNCTGFNLTNIQNDEISKAGINS